MRILLVSILLIYSFSVVGADPVGKKGSNISACYILDDNYPFNKGEIVSCDSCKVTQPSICVLESGDENWWDLCSSPYRAVGVFTIIESVIAERYRVCLGPSQLRPLFTQHKPGPRTDNSYRSERWLAVSTSSSGYIYSGPWYKKGFDQNKSNAKKKARNRYDRGHLTPNVAFNQDETSSASTFLSINRAPQYSRFNSHSWKCLEGRITKLDPKMVYTGVHGESSIDIVPSISGFKAETTKTDVKPINIYEKPPGYFWKVIEYTDRKEIYYAKNNIDDTPKILPNGWRNPGSDIVPEALKSNLFVMKLMGGSGKQEGSPSTIQSSGKGAVNQMELTFTTTRKKNGGYVMNVQPKFSVYPKITKIEISGSAGAVVNQDVNTWPCSVVNNKRLVYVPWWQVKEKVREDQINYLNNNSDLGKVVLKATITYF